LKAPKKASALNEIEGVLPVQSIGAKAIANFKRIKSKRIDATEIFEGLRTGNMASLSQAITLIESTQPKHQALANDIIQNCLPYANQSVRIGITGIPGVGKSTFIEAFGKHLTQLGKKVAVLAIDPSSSLSRGSILGDKTRMEELVKDPNAFIRPSASGTSLGGVAQKTRESIMLCEAAGYDTILIETVGVGQSETAVHSMVDFFLLLKISGAGDELQGIKRGIMEMADLIVINKADGDNINKAKLAKTEFNRALHLFPPKPSDWTPQVLTCSAMTHDGIADIWQNIMAYINFVQENHFFQTNRNQQNFFWMQETINAHLKNNFYQQPAVKQAFDKLSNAVKNNELSPFVAANRLLDKYFKNINP
jgi:LAO/AO transport system kinase